MFTQKFLGQYGYMPSTLSGNVAMARAIRNFQEFYGLEMNGILDESTVNLMKKPRCGVPDASSGMRKKRYSVYVAWRINHLKYYVKPGLDLPHVSTNLTINFIKSLIICSRHPHIRARELRTSG